MRGCRSKMLKAVLLAVVLSAYMAGALADAPAPVQAPRPSCRVNLWGHGKYVVAFCQDRGGRIWVGAEDEGVYRYDPSKSGAACWAQFTKAGGLGDDNAYAIACDWLGRIWVGTLNHGVSVYNGQGWKTYDQLTGPSGHRVFAIALSPVNGDVWIGTEAGLSRYSQASDTWLYYSVANGMSSNSVSALAFDSSGNLYVGTQCDGLCIGSAKTGYRIRRKVGADDNLPPSSQGTGFPCNLVNDVLVTRENLVLAGTDHGLARSADGGATWSFLHGADWRDNVEGRSVSTYDDAFVNGMEIVSVVGNRSRTDSYQGICCGDNDESNKCRDRYYEGGSPKSLHDTVEIEGVGDAGPANMYHTARTGRSFKYLIPNLWPSEDYTVRLYFVETSAGQPKQRQFNVSVNGSRVLSAFDIFTEAGNKKDRAVVREIKASADAGGEVEVEFDGVPRIPGYVGGAPLMTEDYVTKLAQDNSGNLWIGHRTAGVEMLAVDSLETLAEPSEPEQCDYVSALLGSHNGMYVGWYRAGLTKEGSVSLADDAPPTAPAATVAFPSPAAAPSLDELSGILTNLAAAGAASQSAVVVPMDDDWLTGGDWLGRYGRYWACLCATCSPCDYLWGAGWDRVEYCSRIGSVAAPGDSLRYWVQWLYSDNPRVLELPPVYLDSRIRKKLTTANMTRREAEIDDHGEGYPWFLSGPGVYVTLAVPKGVYFLSLYDLNCNGHDGTMRARDYRISIRRHPDVAALSDISSFAHQPELAHGRIVNFWGGVWKRFLVRGPIDLTVELNRNNSMNTILPAVMLDLVDEEPPPYFETLDRWRNRRMENDVAHGKLVTSLVPATEAEAAGRIFGLLGAIRYVNPTWWAQNKQTFYLPLLRWYAKQNGGVAPTEKTSRKLALKLGTCCYQLDMYKEWEACQKQAGLRTAREIEMALKWDGFSEDSDREYEILCGEEL